MNKFLLMTAGLLLMPLPALSQSAPDSGSRDPGSIQDREIEDLLRSITDEVSGGSGGPRRGAAFLLRSGDATVAVRCDPRESMKDCVDLTTSLLEKARSAMPTGGGAPEPRRRRDHSLLLPDLSEPASGNSSEAFLQGVYDSKDQGCGVINGHECNLPQAKLQNDPSRRLRRDVERLRHHARRHQRPRHDQIDQFRQCR